MIGRLETSAAASQADAIGKQLDELSGAAEDLRPVWPEVGEVFAERQEKVFSTGSFGRWSPLKAETMIKKAKTSISASTILVDSGMLRKAATDPTVINSSPASAEFGVRPGDLSRLYAVYHVRGQGVPQRQPVPKMTPTERRRLIEKIQDHIRKALD
jgi:hypothetical protein